MQMEEQKSNLHMINVSINIWDDYSENNPNIYKNKSYHTYAYVEDLEERMNINGEIKLRYIPHDELDLNQDELMNMKKDILVFFQKTLIQENLIKETESFIEIFDPLIAYDFTLPFWKTPEGIERKKFFENKKSYQLFFTNLPYEKLKTDIKSALDKFNQQKLSFVKDNYCFNLDIYSES